MVSLSYQHLRKIQTTRRVILCISLPYFLVVFHTIMMNFINKVLCHFESCFPVKHLWLVCYHYPGPDAAFRQAWYYFCYPRSCALSGLLWFHDPFFSLILLVAGKSTSALVFGGEGILPTLSGRRFPCPCGGRGKAVQRRAADARSEETVSGIRKLC